MITQGLQFDSTSPLPFTPALELRYVNGRFARPVAYRRGLVWIDVNGSAPERAMWLDVERFDASPEQAPVFLDKRRAAGLSEGGIYVNRSNLAEVERLCGQRPHLLIVATLDGTLTVPAVPGIGVLACVQAYPASMLGFTADASVVVDPGYWEQHALATA